MDNVKDTWRKKIKEQIKTDSLQATIEKTDKYIEKELTKHQTRIYESDYYRRIAGNNNPLSIYVNDIGTLTFQIEQEEGVNYAGTGTYLLVGFTLETRLLDLSGDTLDMLIKHCLEEYLELYYAREYE